MSDERAGHPTDAEPDGSTAHAASLRPPGDSVRSGTTPEVTGEQIAPDAAPAGDEPVMDTAGGAGHGAGYDVAAVSGDAEQYRPD